MYINFSAKTLIRDDKVMNIKYPDNSTLTIHEDNTKIFTFPDHLKYLVEHDSKSTFIITKLNLNHKFFLISYYKLFKNYF